MGQTTPSRLLYRRATRLDDCRSPDYFSLTSRRHGQRADLNQLQADSVGEFLPAVSAISGEIVNSFFIEPPLGCLRQWFSILNGLGQRRFRDFFAARA